MKQINVAAAVIIKDDQILAGKREGGRLGSGAWELPGGKIQAGEDPRVSLQRELEEELGSNSMVGERVLPTVVHQYPWGEVHMQIFYARLTNTELKANAHTELRWGTPNELAELNWLPAAKPVLAKLAEVDLTQIQIENPAQFYTHQVEYYETDRMGITHHSNYVRWMEEARTRFFAVIGWDYGQLEQTGIISPVVSVNCRYKQTTTFGDQVDIKLTVKHLDRVKLTLGYEMTCEGNLVCLGESEHCFTKDGRLLRVDRELPELYQLLANFVAWSFAFNRFSLLFFNPFSTNGCKSWYNFSSSTQIIQKKGEFNMQFSQRILNVQPSATLALSAKAKAMQAQGIDVLNLTVGEPDFNTPAHIHQAAITAINDNQADSYTAATGILPLREAVADFNNQQHGTNFTAENVVMTVGGKFALYALSQVLLNPGDEVLIPLPAWVSYSEQVKLAGGTPVFATPPAGQLKVTPADLEAVWTPKTKVLILNSPNNPTGEVYS